MARTHPRRQYRHHFTTHGALRVDVSTGGFGENAALQDDDFQALSSATLSQSVAGHPNGFGSLYTVDFAESELALIDKGVNANTQFRMYFALDDNDDGDSDYAGFYSPNNDNSSRHPRLIVTY